MNSPIPDPLPVLDTVHREILHHVDDLVLLAQRMQAGDADPRMRMLAARIEQFFSQTARGHHEMEERLVFPDLLANGSDDLVRAIRALKQDHGWIEENWIVLQPQLSAIAQGHAHQDPEGFIHGAEVFAALLREHVRTEESLIYPESRRFVAAQVEADHARQLQRQSA